MSKNITPSTLEGISSLAKDIKREQAIPHHTALDKAAIKAGFQNYRHAQNVSKNRASARYQIFLTCYWKAKDSGIRGRETLTMLIDQPLTGLVTSPQRSWNPKLGRARFSGPDHLEISTLSDSQSRARESVCEMARTIQFMNATGLKPCRGIRAYPKSNPSLSIPGQDHATTWYDPNTKRYLLVDEPYQGAVHHLANEREVWARHHGYNVVLSSWPGMYFPDGGSRLYLIADAKKGVPVEPIVKALERLPAPIVSSSWPGESAPFPPPFISPGAIALHEASKQRQATPSKKSVKRNTVQYVNPIFGASRRPDAKMPIEAHQQVGQIIKTVLADTYFRNGVRNRINSVRCELDEWVQREYRRSELSDEVFFKMYYQGEHTNFNKQLATNIRLQHIVSMERVKALLTKHYPDCPPLRRLINKLDSAIMSMDSWL